MANKMRATIFLEPVGVVEKLGSAVHGWEAIDGGLRRRLDNFVG